MKMIINILTPSKDKRFLFIELLLKGVNIRVYPVWLPSQKGVYSIRRAKFSFDIQ
jgi:hypothetical protein